MSEPMLRPAPDSLPELLRIMDVATALRQERERAAVQLDIDQVKVALRHRLRATADTMGEPVTDAEIEAAIARYFDQLHELREPPPGWRRTLALLYVRRRLVLAAAALGAIALAIVWWTFASASSPWSPTARRARLAAERAEQQARAVQEAARALDRVRALHQIVRGLAQEAGAVREAEALVREAEAAHQSGQPARVARATAGLDELRHALEEEFEVRVVNRPREDSGVFRNFDGRLSGYYLVVEALGADGSVLPRRVRDAEDGDKTKVVRKWGEQVPKAVYDRIAADKRADGIVDENLFARKRRGIRAIEVVMPHAPGGPPMARARQITSV